MAMISSALNVIREHKQNDQTSSKLINAKQMAMTSSALNVTQGHKRSYQTSSKLINAKPLDKISLILNVTRDTSEAIKQALNQSIKYQGMMSACMFLQGLNYF